MAYGFVLGRDDFADSGSLQRNLTTGFLTPLALSRELYRCLQNGERSLSVSFCRGDIRYSLAETADPPDDGKLGGTSDNDSATQARQQKHNFEGIKSSSGSQIPHRGDLVVFDVVLNRA